MATAKRQAATATRHVALLRGVNVNGITIKSADLKALFVELGFGAVRTVLASGNVLFDTDESDAAALRTRIEQALRKRFGYDAWIVLLTQKTVAAIAAAYPFERIDEERHPYIVFGSDKAMLDEIMEKAGTVDAKPIPSGSNAARACCTGNALAARAWTRRWPSCSARPATSRAPRRATCARWKSSSPTDQQPSSSASWLMSRACRLLSGFGETSFGRARPNSWGRSM